MARTTRPHSLAWRVVGVLAPIALVLVLVTSNVRWASNSLPLYTALFDRHNVTQRSGITTEGLRAVGQEIQDYFNSDTEPLLVVAEVNGQRTTLFSDQEVEHMADVKGMFHLTWQVQTGSALFLLLLGSIGAVRFRSGAWSLVGRWLRNGAALTIAAVLILGTISAVAFGPLFTAFHRLGFRNNLWLLDPRTDPLVQIFPFGFWRDVTLLIGLAAIVEAVLVLVAVYGGRACCASGLRLESDSPRSKRSR